MAPQEVAGGQKKGFETFGWGVPLLPRKKAWGGFSEPEQKTKKRGGRGRGGRFEKPTREDVDLNPPDKKEGYLGRGVF